MQQIRAGRLLATIVGGGLGLTLSVPDLAASARAVTGPDVAEAMAGVAVLTLATLSLWLLVASALVTLALRTGAGAGLARRLAPSWLAATLSTGALLLGSSAQATPADLDGLPLPDRAPATAALAGPAAHESPAVGPETPRTGARSVVVRAGDCLWELAREHAAPTATDLDVARLTVAWHEANRAVIGPDPDALHPGQVLAVPAEGAVAP